jgi:hypothetical protein
MAMQSSVAEKGRIYTVLQIAMACGGMVAAVTGVLGVGEMAQAGLSAVAALAGAALELSRTSIAK